MGRGGGQFAAISAAGTHGDRTDSPTRALVPDVSREAGPEAPPELHSS